jgi:DNA-binding beta-propeller fold protein YncE
VLVTGAAVAVLGISPGPGDRRAQPAPAGSDSHQVPPPVSNRVASQDGDSFACPCPNLAPGSSPASLPGPVLVADHLNNRLLIIDPNGSIAWEFPPRALAPSQSFLVPDDAFFTPDGRYIVATQEDDFVISLISVATHRVVWQYGTPGVHGSGSDQLWNPDDAIMLPDGDVIAADIKNCRLVVLRPPMHAPLRTYGITTNACIHAPPQRWGSPNGAFPMAHGQYLVTEINGDWVDGLNLDGQVTFSVHPPGVSYPSDTNEVRPGVYLTSDYSRPGQVEEFNQAGHLLWRYKPSGTAAMNRPSLALPLPNGDILCNDDFNHRVIVVDPRTNTIVWQYGHTGTAGSSPGYLDDPDGVDLLPPYSLAITHASTMGDLPVPPGTPSVPGESPGSPP